MPADRAAHARGSAGAGVSAKEGSGGGVEPVRREAGRVVEFWLGDVVRLRRPHPCGGRDWTVDRLGADIGLRCRGCDHHVLIERRTLERRLVGFVTRGDRAMTEAVAPAGREDAPATREAAPRRAELRPEESRS